MKFALSRRSRVLALAISAALASASPALAATLTWDGGTGGTGNQFNDAANWNPNGVPNNTTDAVFGAVFPGADIQLSAVTLNSLTINSTNSFKLFGNFFFNDYLDPGTVTRSAGAGGNQVLSEVGLKSNEVWNISGSGSLTASDVREIGGSHSLTKNGSGLLIFDDETSNYSGGTIVNAGTVEIDAFDPVGTGPVTIASGAVLSFKLVPLHNFAVLSRTLNVSGSGINSNGAVRGLSDSFVDGHVNLQGNTSFGANSGARLTISGVISDGSSSFTLTKVGAGTVELAAANTYGGNTTVSEGTLTVSHDGALGNGASATVVSGAALNIRDGATISQNLLLNGTGISGNGAFRNFTGNNTASGVLLMQSNSTIGSDAGSLTISGAIAGNFSLTKVGGGSLILTNGNVYSGVTDLQEGKIRVRTNTSLGSGDVFVTSGAALELQETTSNLPLTINKTLHLNGDGPSGNGALRNISSNNTWAGNIILESNSTIGVDADNLNISSATSGAFNLTKVGAGTLILTNLANNHANTIVDGGILGITTPGAFPIAGVITVHSGAMAEFQSSIQMARSLNLNGTGINNLGALHSPSGNTGWTSPITLQADSSIGVSSGELRITGAIGGTAALNKVGAGKLTLAGSNTYSGTTNITAGILSVESNGAIPANATAIVSPGAALELRGGVSSPATLTLNATGILGTGAMRNVLGSNAWTGPITLNTSDASIGVDAGTQLTVAGPISDGTSLFPLTKTGAGTLVLSGSNTYKGGTLINGGTVQISGDNAVGAGTGTVTSNNGGKLLVAANTATSRTFNLNNGSLQVNSGAILQYNNATVNGGFLRGPGTHQINAGSSFNGVTALNGNSITQSQPTTLVNFTNAGSLLSAAALTWDGGFNTPAGNITVNSAFNTQAFENDGIMTINSGGNVTNTSSSFVSGAGGRITINPGGQLNAGPSLELGASLLINNGTITGTTNVNFLALAKGSGTYGPVNVLDGGKFSPGNSPGSVTTGSTTWNSGGGYVVEIADAIAGAGIGWDEWNINGALNLNATSTTNGRFTISLSSLDALAANFDNTHDYDWTILHADGGILGFDPSELNLDSSGFKNNLGTGRFSLESTSQNLTIHFSSVPEPLSSGLLALAGISVSLRRRKK